jgi:hypothetical protein
MDARSKTAGKVLRKVVVAKAQGTEGFFDDFFDKCSPEMFSGFSI